VTPDFRAEVSLLKTEETRRYGARGSIRIDIYEKTTSDTVCVYDIKTGDEGLLWGRSFEIAGRVQRSFGFARRIIVTEIRPAR
jgi:hypothetical protein